MNTINRQTINSILVIYTRGGTILNHLYIVYALEGAISVIKSKSKEEAFDIFAVNQIDNKNYNIFIKSLSINDGLLEEFYQDDQGYLFDIEQNKYPERLQQLNEQEKEDYIDVWIERNAKEFWKDEPQFALEYLQELDKAKQSNTSYTIEFSDEFLVFTLKKIIQQGDWYEGFDIVKIDLTDKNYQVIYKD